MIHSILTMIILIFLMANVVCVHSIQFLKTKKYITQCKQYNILLLAIAFGFGFAFVLRNIFYDIIIIFLIVLWNFSYHKMLHMILEKIESLEIFKNGHAIEYLHTFIYSFLEFKCWQSFREKKTHFYRCANNIIYTEYTHTHTHRVESWELRVKVLFWLMKWNSLCVTMTNFSFHFRVWIRTDSRLFSLFSVHWKNFFIHNKMIHTHPHSNTKLNHFLTQKYTAYACVCMCFDHQVCVCTLHCTVQCTPFIPFMLVPIMFVHRQWIV